MSLYNRLGAAVSTAMGASSTSTSDHMNGRMAEISNGWEASSKQTETDYQALDAARKAEYATFEGNRNADHAALLEDMLENVIGEVNASVALLVTTDATFDKQFQDDNAARLAAWAAISERIGVDSDIDIK
jgi:hypothetical protein